MDTRLLRLWSNCEAKLGFSYLILFVFLSTLLTVSKVALGSAQPFANGILIWDARNNIIQGQLTYAFPISHSQRDESEVSDEFWLLPNRDLAAATPDYGLNREQVEFRSASPETEWPLNESGLGALRIDGVDGALLQHSCPSSGREMVSLTDEKFLKTIPFEFLADERVLKIRSQIGQRISSGARVSSRCRIVRIKFLFNPRLGNGNFAQHADGSASFAGPVFPLWRNKPVRTSLTIRTTSPDSKISCLGCSLGEKNGTELMFVGLPPPVHFTMQKPPLILKFENLKPDPESRSRIEDANLTELNETLEVFEKYTRPSFELHDKKRPLKWQVNLSLGLPIEQLLVEQVNEIQLHSSFGQVTPLLADFHRAALFRSLARSFVRFLLKEEDSDLSWVKIRQNESIARIIAEVWLRDAFPKLSRLRDLSDKFSFLPFFRAVQQGNAFVNNAVFVGGEESESLLDYAIYEDVLAPLRGAELLDRLDVCSLPAVRESLRVTAVDIARGKKQVVDFVQLLSTAKPSDGCTVPMETGLLPASTQEEVIDLKETQKGKLQLRRKDFVAQRTMQFLFSSDPVLRDPLRIQLTHENSEMSMQIHRADSTSESVIDLPASIKSAQVLSPHRAVSSDRLQFPRPYRTVLQALALNYDSRRSDLTLKSQFQTSQQGDEWGRTLALGLRREYQQNFLDLQLQTGIPSLFAETRSAITLASTTRLVEAPPSFLSVSYSLERGSKSPVYPDGVGFKVWLRRPLTLSASREKMSDPAQEWMINTAVPLASRLTWFESVSYGRSDTAVDAGLRSVPGWPAGTFQSAEYVALRSETRNTLVQNLNASIARSVLFQHAILYAAHVIAFDQFQSVGQGTVSTRTAQSVLTGIRLLGSLFGAKDQALGFEVARALTDPPRTSFGMSIGKALN